MRRRKSKMRRRKSKMWRRRSKMRRRRSEQKGRWWIRRWKRSQWKQAIAGAQFAGEATTSWEGL